jgi:glycosyltransferase involved in cell wall biosynthesis
MRPITIPKYIQQIFYNQNSTENTIDTIRNAYLSKTTDLPIISIVIPAYNEEKSILQTLLSLSFNNTNEQFEIIVVNNNSSDNTEHLVKATGIICITETKQGITAARNAGLQQAKGKFILNADADTIYPKDWINEMINPLLNKSVALSYGRFAFIPTDKTPRLVYFFYEYFSDVIKWVNKYLKDEAVNVYGFNSAYRREEGIAVEGYNHPPGSNEDGYLALKLRNSGYGKLHKVKHKNALVWTTDRRIESDGGLIIAVIKRIKGLLIKPKEIIIRSDL